MDEKDTQTVGEITNVGENNYCFIINNYEFQATTGKEDKHLNGYVFDVKSIIETFDGLNFKVQLEENITALKIRRKCFEWSQMDFSETGCVVLFILSHGHENGVIFGTGFGEILIGEIISIFTSCEKLKHVPKLIFIQACRGDQVPLVREDTVVSTDIGFGKDIDC